MSTMDDGFCYMHYFNRVNASKQLSPVSSTPGTAEESLPKHWTVFCLQHWIYWQRRYWRWWSMLYGFVLNSWSLASASRGWQNQGFIQVMDGFKRPPWKLKWRVNWQWPAEICWLKCITAWLFPDFKLLSFSWWRKPLNQAGLCKLCSKRCITKNTLLLPCLRSLKLLNFLLIL